MMSVLWIVAAVLLCTSAFGWLAWQQNRTRLADASDRLAALEKRCAEQQTAIESAEARRRASEEQLHASEERYALALRGSQDGLWEWDIASDTVHVSPR